MALPSHSISNLTVPLLLIRLSELLLVEDPKGDWLGLLPAFELFFLDFVDFLVEEDIKRDVYCE